MESYIENEFMSITKEKNLLFCTFGKNLNLTLESARICVEGRIGFSEGKSWPALIDMTGIISVTKEARDYMGKEGAQFLTAGALLIHSPFSKILGNLFLSINKPEIPTKLFTSEKDARRWLAQFKIIENTQM